MECVFLFRQRRMNQIYCIFSILYIVLGTSSITLQQNIVLNQHDPMKEKEYMLCPKAHGKERELYGWAYIR